MDNMLYYASSFDQTICGWDLGGVTVDNMLTGSSGFVVPICITDTASIRTAVSAWCDNEASATTTYGHISMWDTSGVDDMSHLFAPTDSWPYGNCSSASTFNSNISNWNGKCRWFC